jgi:glycosyltransferase involved in cell wall biosynthesis
VTADTTPPKKAAFTRLSSRPIPRVARMMDAATDLGFQAVFLAARREENLPKRESYAGHSVKRIGPYFPLLNGRSAWLYIRSVLAFNRDLYRELRELRPEIVHCSDIETMPAGVIYRVFFGTRLLYNIHDNLSQRYNILASAQAALNYCEGVAVLLADQTLVPEKFRRDALPSWCRKKVSVVRNTPADPGEAAPQPTNSGRVRLFFGGWLDQGRGLTELLSLVRENEDFELKVAGEGAPELIEKIKSNPRTSFLGFVTHEEIMAETALCHFVCALYNPVRPINRFAASNKLAEALACGRPVLVNSEMLITETLSDYGCLVKLPFRDVQKSAAELMRQIVTAKPEAYRLMCLDARQAYQELYAWDVAMAGMYRALQGDETVRSEN